MHKQIDTIYFRIKGPVGDICGDTPTNILLHTEVRVVTDIYPQVT